MEKQKVFIPVLTEREKPELTNTGTFSMSNEHGWDKIVAHNDMFLTKYWLKEQEGYFFTAEELKNIIGNACAECFTNHGEDCSEDEYYKLKNEYIQSLNIK